MIDRKLLKKKKTETRSAYLANCNFFKKKKKCIELNSLILRVRFFFTRHTVNWRLSLSWLIIDAYFI